MCPRCYWVYIYKRSTDINGAFRLLSVIYKRSKDIKGVSRLLLSVIYKRSKDIKGVSRFLLSVIYKRSKDIKGVSSLLLIVSLQTVKQHSRCVHVVTECKFTNGQRTLKVWPRHRFCVQTFGRHQRHAHAAEREESGREGISRNSERTPKACPCGWPGEGGDKPEQRKDTESLPMWLTGGGRG